jgi:hypothetical protein
VLEQERVDRADRQTGATQSGEDIALFQRLVETFYEIVDDLSAAVDGRNRRGLSVTHLTSRFLIDQEHSL